MDLIYKNIRTGAPIFYSIRYIYNSLNIIFTETIMEVQIQCWRCIFSNVIVQVCVNPLFLLRWPKLLNSKLIIEYTIIHNLVTLQIRLLRKVLSGHYRFKPSILDLPEEVILLIFGFLTDAEIYFEMRNTCRQLRSIADNYVQIGIK